ncbi:MAG: hypothetical protein FVQ82_09560 [Planctomycetes bacterium]|nr:hypothetical protein [Planctomycetota bacterium]
MPHPAYHIGVNSFFGLALRRWVDPFVIVAVNVIIDLEVLFSSGFPDSHRHWYFHTFLVGGIIGAVFGMLCWLFRGIISRAMKLVRIQYKPKLWKMCVAGTLGVWVHVLMDGLVSWDVQPFRPFTNSRALWRMFKHTYPVDQVRRWIFIISVIFSVAAVILYILAVKKFNKSSAEAKDVSCKSEI